MYSECKKGRGGGGGGGSMDIQSVVMLGVALLKIILNLIDLAVRT